MATAELGFKKPLSKEERIEKKKQRLAAIGNLFIFCSQLIRLLTSELTRFTKLKQPIYMFRNSSFAWS